MDDAARSALGRNGVGVQEMKKNLFRFSIFVQLRAARREKDKVNAKTPRRQGRKKREEQINLFVTSWFRYFLFFKAWRLGDLAFITSCIASQARLFEFPRPIL